MKIIFLDIDGVLNCENGFNQGLCAYNDDFGMDFYPPSADLINNLIEETGAKVVISSSWRGSGLQKMQDMWKHRKMAGEVIDVTPTLWTEKLHGNINGKKVSYTPCRGAEIDIWLQGHDFHQIFWSKMHQEHWMDESGIDNFIIIDDDSDMLYNQKEHFIHILPSPRNREGFHQEHYEKAKEILNKNVLELYGFV